MTDERIKELAWRETARRFEGLVGDIHQSVSGVDRITVLRTIRDYATVAIDDLYWLQEKQGKDVGVLRQTSPTQKRDDGRA